MTGILYAMYLWAMARVAEAIAENKRARDLDPLSTLINLDYGRAFFFARRYDEAIEQYRKTLEFDPNSTLAHLFLGLAYEQQGKFDDAVREIARSRELMSYKDFADAILRGYAASGYHGAMRVWAETWERGVPDRAQPSSIAMIYARLGDRDKAMEWLERGFEERTRAMVFINVEPQLDGIRSDPRFKDLQRRMGLVPADSK